jgi:hypothetical protein
MAYIGQSIKNGTFTDLGFTGTFNSSTTDFNLGTQVGSAAQLLVSKNGVIQRPGTDFTLASGGSQISFTTAPASGDSIFIVEISGAIGGPMNRDINGEELILDVDGDTSIQADTDDQIDIKIAGADDFKFTANNFNILSGSTLTIDSGATITNSGTANGFGISEADGFRLTTDMSSSGAVITNLERIDDATFSKIGTGMSVSSGAFTFPSTGLYQVTCFVTLQIASSTSTDLFASVEGQASSNSGGAYDTVFEATGGYEGSNTKLDTIAQSTYVNVTDASAFRFRFVTDSFSSGTNLVGNTNINQTSFFFVRLGDSQ